MYDLNKGIGLLKIASTCRDSNPWFPAFVDVSRIEQTVRVAVSHKERNHLPDFRSFAPTFWFIPQA